MKTASQYILETSRIYSLYTCESRAIPRVADGIKDSQRKALWILRNRSDKTKTISVAGEMISEGLYLHGDVAAANAISLMAAPYCNNTPLLEGIGTFGTRVAPTEWAAPRYTYVKKGRLTDALMFPDLNIVPLVDNYDGSTKEPLHFLPLIPTLLLNGISGIAVGWSTEILPRSLPTLIDACVAVLDGKKMKKLLPEYRYLNVDVREGDGHYVLTGKVEIVDSSTLRVTELPPDLSLEKFKERLNAMEDEEKIVQYWDRSTKTINIEIKFKRGSIKDWNEDQAIAFLKLSQRKTERIVVIDWSGNGIRQYGSAEEVVRDFIDWRLGWYKTRYEVRVQDDSHELIYWQGLEACFAGKLPERLLGMKNREELEREVRALTAAIDLTDEQIGKIVNLSTFRWAKDYLGEVKARIKDLKGAIKQWKALIADKEALKAIYREELMALKKIK